jgi:hypothetical protein
MSEINEFDPVLFSREENEWLLDNLGKPPVVAARDQRRGVNPKAVQPFLTRVQELEALQKHEGIGWIGVEAVKEAIRTYLREDEKWEADHQRRRNAPRFPSLSSYDARKRPHLGGPGSDAGRVRTYFNDKGERLPFAVQLFTDVAADWEAPGTTETSEVGLINNAEFHRWECFCGHTEQYKVGSRGSENAAKGRMSKHLRTTTEEVEKHRELHTLEFGGTK